MREFLSRTDWSVKESIVQDGSSRRYDRVKKSGQTAILMDCSGGETPGHRVQDFLRIGAWLRDIGLNAPEIYEADEAAGFVLMEDFGDVSFRKALGAGHDAAELYALAADVLKHLATQKDLPELPKYYESHVHKNHRYVIEYYAPSASVENYLAAWAEIESRLPPCPQGFLHIDFHVENLMFLPDRDGLKRCGILDFQGAMKGPLPYDLGNLLEDARYDVPEEIRAEILSGFNEDFRCWYRVLTTQFHCRVIGQFIKMAAENGKTGYLQHIPRLEKYILQALKDPLLSPLNAFKCVFSTNRG